MAEYTNSLIERAIGRTFQAVDPSESLLKRVSIASLTRAITVQGEHRAISIEVPTRKKEISA
jgi:hypothetical protein